MSYDFIPLSIANRVRTHLEKTSQVYVAGGVSRAAVVNIVLQFYADAKTQIVICADEIEAEQLRTEFAFFAPQVEIPILQSFDVSPYSSLYPRPHLSSQRIHWLSRAADAKKPGILICTLRSLLQRTMPREIFNKNVYLVKVGSELDGDFLELLQLAGYNCVETVENPGEYAQRGGIFDIFSTSQARPIRLELFGDEIESIREFDVETQISVKNLESFSIAPASEILYSESDIEKIILKFRQSLEERECEDGKSVMRSLVQEQRFPGLEFLLPYFYESAATPMDYCKDALFWWSDKLECDREVDHYFETLKEEYNSAQDQPICPKIFEIFQPIDEFKINSGEIFFAKILLTDQHDEESIAWQVSPLIELRNLHKDADWAKKIGPLIEKWQKSEFHIIIGARNDSQIERVKFLLEKSGVTNQVIQETDTSEWNDWLATPDNNVLIVPRELSESIKLADDRLIFIRDADLLGKKVGKRVVSAQDKFQKEAEKLSFGDLKAGDHVVHSMHGIGIYEGLKVMTINGIDGEYLQIQYKDTDKLYLPVYRLNQLRRYSGGQAQHSLDRLGGTSFEKTKIKVKAKLRDIASDLLALYAKRAEITRPAYDKPSDDYMEFERSFPYDETDDQAKAISEIQEDLSSNKPMDRLVCGDVGFGKTEVAMRAAFRVAHSGKQVAVLAPTTVLTFQHFETFQKRFKNWPLKIRSLNRFVAKSDQRKIVDELARGEVDIIIGTHRLLSQDIKFKDLGLLVLDEEQKFGVAHKEKIRKFKTEVDTLAMSATPIPRTLNLSFVGVRDMSLITTPPVDRIPTRTFVCRFEQETIRKAILTEVQRGGQIFFIHNRVQSIYGLADELRQIVPEVRLRIGHGQMKEDELEKTMTAFFKHEFDMLVCTTIVESGMDVPTANTMFIDQAQNFGLSQLYQLRGRVGRSKQRAYCYLLIPNRQKLDKEAQERLRIIQENTALGSGIRIAHYDLELRGAGDILGLDQKGHINAVGYELYMELLEQTIHELRGDPEKLQNIEPEIDLKIPALIPDKYIQDIRTRLYYYKAFNDIESPDDVDKFEDELRDQFGKLPEQVVNLLGLMLIKSQCKHLGILELRAGPKFVSLKMSEKTPLATEKLIELASQKNKKYAITPDSRLKVRISEISWPRVFEELEYLRDQC